MQYRVIKPFKDELDLDYKVGDSYCCDTEYLVSVLKNNGFIEDMKDEPWKPKVGDTYWFMNTTGIVEDNPWASGLADERRYQLGNYFQAKEEAEKAVEWLKAFKVLRDDTKGFKPDWGDDSQYKYEIHYDGEVDEIDYGEAYECCSTPIIFGSATDAKTSIKTHEKEWRVFLGVEE